MRWIFGFLFTCLCACVMAQEAAEPGVKPKAEIDERRAGAGSFGPSHDYQGARVRVEFIEMQHKTATRLLMEDKAKTADATELRMNVQKLADKGEARIMDTQLLIARNNHRAQVDSVQEYMYSEDYTEPGEIRDMTLPKNFIGKALPESFVTRNLGSNLEVGASIGGNGKSVDLWIDANLVWHAGDKIWHEGKDSAGNPFQVKMPDIYSIRLKTDIICVDGQYCMAGVLSPKSDKGILDHDRKVMVFVKCDVLAAVP